MVPAQNKMPIPPAHPFAVIPLRRWCPKRLNFPALVIGSLTPDMANCLNWDHFTHSLLGSFAFCLPFGILLLVLFAQTRTALATALPSPHREALLPLCSPWKSSKTICIISLLLGTWTHLTWDLVTHNHSSVAQSLGSWTLPLSSGSKEIRVSTVLGILSGLLGTTGVAVTYWLWLRREHGVEPRLKAARVQVGQASSLSRLTEQKPQPPVPLENDGCSIDSPDFRRARDRQDACPTASFPQKAKPAPAGSVLVRWRDVLPVWVPWLATPILVSIPLGMLVTKNQGGLLWIIRAIVEFYLPLQCFSLAAAGFVFGRRASVHAKSEQA